MKQRDSHGFRPCPFSAQCLRLLDDLDSPTISQQFEKFSFPYDLQDEYLLDQLRLHVPDCPTCSALVTHARRVRSQQRAALYSLLQENESEVPSTTPQIFAELYREQNGAASNTKRMQYYLEELVVSPGFDTLHAHGNAKHDLVSKSPTTGRSRQILRNAFSLATIAALVFAAVGLFGHMFASSHSTATFAPVTKSDSNPPTASLAQPVWGSFVVGLTVLSVSSALGVTSIYNYDAATGKRQQLGQSFAADSVQLDSIPHDGQNLLYHYESGKRVFYQTLQSSAKTSYFYQLDASDWNAGNAVWMDSNHVFVADGEYGVVEVDTRTGEIVYRLPVPRTVQLAFYHTPYLYYISGLPVQQGVWPTLYRVNTALSNDQPHKISLRSPGSTYWFSPDGSKIFYLNKGPDGQKGIYAVNIDGTNSQLLRTGDVTPIGYADNNALMFMQEVNDKFQVVQLGATANQTEKVVMPDAAPGAASLCDSQASPRSPGICDNNIALAPYGHELVLNAYYPDGKHKVLYDNLATGQSSVLMQNLTSNIQVQLPGWDTMNVSTSGPLPKLGPAGGQSSTAGPKSTMKASASVTPALQDRYYTRQYVA